MAGRESWRPRVVRRPPWSLPSVLTVGGMLVVLGSLLLTACVGIPTSGPVHQGVGVTNERDEPFTRVIAQPPRPGMKPDQIVQGFLFASGSFDDDHAAARLFLTSDAAAHWNADAGATVYDSSSPTAVGYQDLGDTVRFTAPMAGHISAQGEYSPASGGTARADFTLRRVGGEWRIAKLPDGLLLDTFDVDRSYRSYDIYFPDPSRTVLVPEQVLVPVGPGVSTSLVHALLAGPSPWLAPAVRSAIPTGTKLVVDSVPTGDGVAVVDLTAPAAAVAGRDAAAMSAQFAWTLRQLSGVTSLRITVDDVPLRAPGVGAVQSPDAWPSFDPDGGASDAAALYDTGSRLELLKDDQELRVAGPTGDGSVHLVDPALSMDQRSVAGLDPTGNRLLVGGLGGAAPSTVLRSVGLLAPTWDRFGAVWTVDQAGPVQRFWEAQPGAEATRIAVHDLPAGRIVAFRIARDGVRAVAVVRGPGGGKVYLARIERTGDRPVVAGFRLIPTSTDDVVDVAWGSSDRLVLLAHPTPGAPAQPLAVDLSGNTTQSMGSITGSTIVSVSAAPKNPVLVSTAAGTLYWFTGFGWDSLGGGRDPAYPG
jgi:hypothetical protein